MLSALKLSVTNQKCLRLTYLQLAPVTWLFLGVGLACQAAQAQVPAMAEYEKQRGIFQKARMAIRQNNEQEFLTLKKQLKAYPIASYLDYQALNHQVKTHDQVLTLDAQVRDYLESSAEPHLKKIVLNNYVRQLAKQKQWQLVYRISQEQSLGNQCRVLRAKWEVGEFKNWSENAIALWQKAGNHPKDCQAVFESLEKKENVSIRMVWQRIYNNMEKGRVSNTEALLPYLSERDRRSVSVWTQGRATPAQALKKSELQADTALNRRMIRLLMKRFLRKDPVAAYTHWQAVRGAYTFSSDQRYDIDQRLAMKAVYAQLPEAEQWLAALPVAKTKPLEKTWLVRLAIGKGEWGIVVQRIQALPQNLIKQAEWRYWLARAREQQGEVIEAEKIYQALTQSLSYYGLMSADRLNLSYPINSEALKVDQATFKALEKKTSLLLAREYFYANLHRQGRRHWQASIKGLTREELKAAAALAHAWGWPDRAITTASRAGATKDLSIQYPLPYQHQVTTQAAAQTIAPEWVYGVMRRESLFMPEVASHAGAVGLMQLMPATAGDVAEWVGYRKTLDLANADLNIKLGSRYLRHVLERFNGNLVLATAAYNAGPGRVKSWMPESKPLSADIWVVTMPYTETRNYVQSVLTHTAVFEWQMNQKITRLKQRLKMIPVAKAS